MNALIQLKQTTVVFLVAFGLTCFGFSPTARALSPAPDGGYSNFTTAEGDKALFSLTNGAGNTALGWGSLFLNSTGGFNTGVGAGTLVLNTADENTATGAGALFSNTTGGQNTADGAFALFNNSGVVNTAIGDRALFSNTTGNFNTAVGVLALLSNTTGNGNTAVGVDALSNNTTSNANTAIGASALVNNTTGNANTATGGGALSGNTTGTGNTATGSSSLSSNMNGGNNTANGANALFNNTASNNTANGFDALSSNTTGVANTAIGSEALSSNTIALGNTAVGTGALSNHTSGDGNTAIGFNAGESVVTASDVICIGEGVFGADVSSTTWIGNVYGVTTQNGATAPVIVSADGQLGTAASSERFKKDIATMEKASEAILSLRPVTFHYKTDVNRTPQFGLIAEEVVKVNPALVLPDKEGKPYTVRYEAVNAMLLNEFIKEHRKLEKLEATVASLMATVKEQAAQMQKVTAQLDLNKPSPQTVLNTR